MEQSPVTAELSLNMTGLMRTAASLQKRKQCGKGWVPNLVLGSWIPEDAGRHQHNEKEV